MGSSEELTLVAATSVLAKSVISESGKNLYAQFKERFAMVKAGTLERKVDDYERALNKVLAMDLPLEAKMEIETVHLGTSILKSAMSREFENVRREATVVSYAIEELPGDAEVKEIDEDWKELLMGVVRTAGSEEMLRLYGSILAMEATHPGSYSKRCVSALREFSQWDLKVLEGVTQQTVRDESGSARHAFRAILLEPAVHKPKTTYFGAHSEAISLGIMPAVGEDVTYGVGAGQKMTFTLSNGSLINVENTLQPTQPGVIDRHLNLPLTGIRLTDIGYELCRLINTEPSREIISAVFRTAVKPNLEITATDLQVSALIDSRTISD